MTSDARAPAAPVTPAAPEIDPRCTHPEEDGGAEGCPARHAVALLPAGLPASPAGGLSYRLWRGAEPTAQACLRHPFVQGMATGELPRLAFQHYLGQDFVYLKSFAKAYELTLPKCQTGEVRDAVASFIDGVNKELLLHVGYAASWGVSMDSVAAAPATTAYTDFLLEVASCPDMGVDHVFAAMAPCARLYGFLACQLARAYAGLWEASPYARWIRSYSAEEYLALPALQEKLLDRMAGRVADAELQRLYDRAMELELGFFEASAAQLLLPALEAVA